MMAVWTGRSTVGVIIHVFRHVSPLAVSLVEKHYCWGLGLGNASVTGQDWTGLPAFHARPNQI
jgi:hypothetical protein